MGCSAGGQDCCRYCGFGPYSSIVCVSPPPTTTTTLTAVETVTPPSGQPTRLRIVNNCTTKLNIFYQSGGGQRLSAPQGVPLSAFAPYDFPLPDEGLIGFRVWAGWGCDDFGNNCVIGGSGGTFTGGVPPGTGDLGCSSQYGCGPPVDSKFEGTFSCLKGGGSDASCVPGAPNVDWADVSLVDGYTLPYVLKLVTPGGFNDPCDAGLQGKMPFSIDCRGLDIGRCPTSENIQNGPTVNLTVSFPATGQAGGCFSPCSKLTSRQWNPTGTHYVDDSMAALYCCPTPPISSEACRAGPIEQTGYVRLVHKMCPGVYSYAYDDAMGLFTCPRGTKYELTFFCPVNE